MRYRHATVWIEPSSLHSLSFHEAPTSVSPTDATYRVAVDIPSNFRDIGIPAKARA